jgi:hypothetical protein
MDTLHLACAEDWTLAKCLAKPGITEAAHTTSRLLMLTMHWLQFTSVGCPKQDVSFKVSQITLGMIGTDQRRSTQSRLRK